MRFLTYLARRFVAGDSLDEAISVVRRLNQEGLKVTLDNLGEGVQSRPRAIAARDEYLLMLKRISETGADCNVSLKLSQFGLNLDENLARDNVSLVAEQARIYGNFVRIDMEGSTYTQKTLDLFYSLSSAYDNIGVVLQASLRRSQQDMTELVRRRARVRLCKGAYKEPAEIAYPDKTDVDSNYDKLARMLVTAPVPAFATHDDERIVQAAAAATAAGLKKSDFEIQMLYGLRPKRWKELTAAGHVVRIYVPYGTHWLPYYYRRLRERKENIGFALKGLFS